jgi:hypothetical protein
MLGPKEEVLTISSRRLPQTSADNLSFLQLIKVDKLAVLNDLGIQSYRVI